MAHEVTSSVRCAWWYPLGIVDAMLRQPQPSGDSVHDTPVVLVHGFGHNRSGWTVAQEHLRRAGFTSVFAMNYTPMRHDIPELGYQLAERVKLVRMLTGAERVHLVGHSLGGLLIRWYVQELDGAEVVDTAITVASPHEGAWLASAAVGRTARQLVPGSWVLEQLARPVPPDRSGTRTRWIAYYSNLDLLVPTTSAMIRHPDLRATNIFVRDHGHLSSMVSPRVARSIVDQLESAEGVPGTAELLPLAVPASGSGDVNAENVIAIGH
jgi:pimeloyl-ACP methyl ester carboxylesterase